MLDTQSLERRMACERIKDALIAAERHCEHILNRFQHLEREPTAAERDARLSDYLDNQARLRDLGGQLQDLNRLLQSH